jgi:hypothetical protein
MAVDSWSHAERVIGAAHDVRCVARTLQKIAEQAAELVSTLQDAADMLDDVVAGPGDGSLGPERILCAADDKHRRR